jgi:nickel transport protein
MQFRYAWGVALLVVGCLGLLQPVMAHFQVLVPSTETVAADGDRKVELDIVFTHPMDDGPAMEMAPPKRFGVLLDGQKTDLTKTLRKRKVQGRTAWSATFAVKRPGDHIFYIEPAPYWEPAERKMIVHYTKVVVHALGEQDGWDAAVGFPVEIEPLVRPYGLWTGNLFRGVVKKDGKPAPFARIEVEYRNTGAAVKLPDEVFTTQVIKADAAGTFAYAMPRAGWWCFAALLDGDKPMKNPQGRDVDVELGALIWVNCTDMK